MVRPTWFEQALVLPNKHLKLARLPIPPRAHLKEQMVKCDLTTLLHLQSEFYVIEVRLSTLKYTSVCLNVSWLIIEFGYYMYVRWWLKLVNDSDKNDKKWDINVLSLLAANKKTYENWLKGDTRNEV